MHAYKTVLIFISKQLTNIEQRIILTF